jgi:hypothetical protein
MKKILLFILLTNLSSIIKAQDTLTMRTGENIAVKIIEIGTTEVKYKKLDNLNGPSFSVLKSDLSMIRLENGTKEDFSNIKKIETFNSDENLFIKGQNDATLYYKGYKTAGTSVLVSTGALPFYGIFLGIAPAVLCASAEPQEESLDYPDQNLMKNDKYAAGYKLKAKQIKRKKVIGNYVSGIAMQGGWVLVFLIGLFNISH